MNVPDWRLVDDPGRARRLSMITYNVTVAIALVAITAGVYLVAGLGLALIAFGAVALALSVYSAERLNRRGAPRVLDRTADT